MRNTDRQHQTYCKSYNGCGIDYYLKLPCFSGTTEPVGSKPPTFSSESKGSIFDKAANSSFALLCQAQAFPVPIMR